MQVPHNTAQLPLLGIIGFGAFARLMAHHLGAHFRIRAYDPALPAGSMEGLPAVEITDMASAARCPIVVLATPVSALKDVLADIAPHLGAGTLVLDVGSVKVIPAEIMARGLPSDVDIVATHPLFGPQSARDGLAGLKIAVCPIRGRRGLRVAAFLRRALGLDVIVTTPQAHDRDAAVVQGLTHLIAKVLVKMEPLPTRMTTRSFDLIMQAVGMVRYDAPAVFQAIERSNPYAAAVRNRFFTLAAALDLELEDHAAKAGTTALQASMADRAREDVNHNDAGDDQTQAEKGRPIQALLEPYPAHS
ncbi:MAG: prephenate dehydrogenase [Chelatococcus sp.]|jgi:prephenate dehydrogenase|uniref:prephenate dehydrogenase n=1 Tax=Chelatococcus sp. TaxID=1953771 RepID=UPI0025C23A73|nr:prephenate dehydrogenase [Chelatococcus sp.]MBX3537305.1 prephenate dehydrogenase [Chelatococcus sp.]